MLMWPVCWRDWIQSLYFFLITIHQIQSAHLPTLDGIVSGSSYFPVSSVNVFHFQGSKRQSNPNKNFNFSSTWEDSFSFDPIGLGPSLITCIVEKLAFLSALFFLSLASFPSVVGVRGGEIKGQGQVLSYGWSCCSQTGVPSASQGPKCGFLPLLQILLSPCSRGTTALSASTDSGWRTLSPSSCCPGSSA